MAAFTAGDQYLFRLGLAWTGEHRHASKARSTPLHGEGCFHFAWSGERRRTGGGGRENEQGTQGESEKSHDEARRDETRRTQDCEAGA